MDDKTNPNETPMPVEKFSGWKKPDTVAETPAPEGDETITAPALAGVAGVSTEAAFPSLADAAKVQTVAPTQSSPTTSPGPETLSRGPPRFIVDKEKLRAKIEKRNAQDGVGLSKIPSDNVESGTANRFSSLSSALEEKTSVPPATVTAPKATSDSSVARGRPRFVLDKEKLREKIEKRNAAAPSTGV